MKINKIFHSNTHLLFELVRRSLLTSRQIGNNISKILANINISFLIDDVTIFESFFFKALCGGNITHNNTHIENSVDKDLNPDLYQYTRSLINMSSIINEDTDISFKPSYMYLPSGTVKMSILVTFKGNSILTLLETNYIKFISSQFQIVQDGDGFVTDILGDVDIEKFNDFITNNLLKNLCQTIDFLNKKIDFTCYEILYDSYIKHAKLLYGDTISITSVDIQGYTGVVDFIDSTVPVLTRQIDDLVSSARLLDEPNHIYNNLDFTFMVTSSLQTFLWLYIDTDILSDFEDIQVLLSTEQQVLQTEIVKVYNTRLVDTINNVRNISHAANTKIEDMLKKYNYIMLNTQIRYTVKVSPSSLDQFLHYIDSHKELDGSVYYHDIVTIYEKVMTTMNKVFNTIEKR